MILSDGDIAAQLDSDAFQSRLERDDEYGLGINGLENPEEQIQPASIDLRLGSSIKEFRDDVDEETVINPLDGVNCDQYMTELTSTKDDPYILEPGGFVLAETIESVDFPPDLVGKVDGRSTFGRLGITAHVTAGFIDPGYGPGIITLEVKNLGDASVALPPGIRFSQLIVNELSNPAVVPYGDERDSHYQNQTGPKAPNFK